MNYPAANSGNLSAFYQPFTSLRLVGWLADQILVRLLSAFGWLAD
ncbi:MAG TPA: hypothetical protein PK874_01120 [Desulfobacteraceae bacterium]|nr:hypothetical protein [Desulfobacteraceae bacterium]HPJ68053.1 hypothetical protein [Desulfobacteraceae bacterium]HPQ28394.1 hypothetical protein [Desulfobacteraceae bacterium]